MSYVKPNFFAKKCRWCGERVPPRAGTVKNVGGKNVVRHKACKGPSKKEPPLGGGVQTG